MPWMPLCPLDQLVEGEGKFVAAGEYQLAVFLHEGRPYVLDNRCPHAGASLSGGHVENGLAVCPWHYWSFELDTGELHNRPIVRVRTYPVRLVEREGKRPIVEADLPDPPVLQRGFPDPSE